MTGGGLVRSMGGWARVGELKRGRENWAYDERVLGSSEFVVEVLEEVSKDAKQKNIGHKVGAEVLSALVDKVGSILGLSRAELIGGSRRRSVVGGRNLICYVAIHGYGMSLTQVAKALNVSVQSILRGVDRGKQEFGKRGWAISDFN